MKTLRNLAILIAVIISIMGVVAAINISPFFMVKQTTFLYTDEIEGISVINHGLEYPLNFEQKNKVVELLNASKKFKSNEKMMPKIMLEPEGIIIYLFKKPELVLSLVGSYNEELLFAFNQSDSPTYLRDISNGALKELLFKTYD